MEHLEQGLEEVERSLVGGLVDGLRLAVDVGGLHHLQIPTRELVCEELEGSHQSLVEAVLGVEVIDFGHLGTHLRLHPLYGLGTGLRLLYVGHLPALYQAEGIPYLVAEVGSLLAKVLLEEDVIAGRSGQQHSHAHAVGTILVYQTNGVGAVAQ